MSAVAQPFPLFPQNTWTSSNARPESGNQVLPDSLRRLICLLDESGEDDYGQMGPSRLSFKTAMRIVSDAVCILGQDLPCAPVVDSEGGIRITWNRYDRQVKLICPSFKEDPVYVYQNSPSGSSLRNQNVTGAVLAERLSWLINRESQGTD